MPGKKNDEASFITRFNSHFFSSFSSLSHQTVFALGQSKQLRQTKINPQSTFSIIATHTTVGVYFSFPFFFFHRSLSPPFLSTRSHRFHIAHFIRHGLDEVQIMRRRTVARSASRACDFPVAAYIHIISPHSRQLEVPIQRHVVVACRVLVAEAKQLLQAIFETGALALSTKWICHLDTRSTPQVKRVERREQYCLLLLQRANCTFSITCR